MWKSREAFSQHQDFMKLFSWPQQGYGGGEIRALMGLKNEFLYCLHCKPCTCYLNLTCHKSNSSKQDGTGLLSTFICVDAGNDAGMWKWQTLQTTQSKGFEDWTWGPLEAETQGRGRLCDLGYPVSYVQTTWDQGISVASRITLTAGGLVSVFLSCNKTFQFPFIIVP